MAASFSCTHTHRATKQSINIGEEFQPLTSIKTYLKLKPIHYWPGFTHGKMQVVAPCAGISKMLRVV